MGSNRGRRIGMIKSKPEIISGLEESFEEVASCVEALSDRDFETAPQDKWAPGTQVLHLTRSAEPVNTALRLPRFVPALLFGKSRRPSNDFDWVVSQYRSSLEQGGEASGRYVPEAVPATQRASTIGAYRREKQRLVTALSKWSEEALDRYQLPHPLIGKLTVREILFFTVYHTRHHAESIRRLTSA